MIEVHLPSSLGGGSLLTTALTINKLSSIKVSLRKTKVVNRGGEDRSGGRRQSQPTPLVCSHNKKKPAAPARGAWLQGPYCSLQLLTASFFATRDCAVAQ